MDLLVQPDQVALVVHIIGTALFAVVFWFLHRESGAVYFSYWALAWGLLNAALWLLLAWVLTGRKIFLAPYALLELAFAASIIFAGASVFRDFDFRLSHALLLFPVVAVAAYILGLLSDFRGFYALHSLLLAAAYGFNLFAFRQRWVSRRGTGRKLFSVSLLAGSLFYFHYALLYGSLHFSEQVPPPAYLRYHSLYNLLLEMLLAFSAMMMQMEVRQEELEQVNRELAARQSEMALHVRIDPLTSLFNRTALNETCDIGEPVTGVVAVLDLDNFKAVNDALGHLYGDEVLANVGNLIKVSVRKDDMAWRWGGDEFVLLFRDQSLDAVEERLRGLQARLIGFHLRGKGPMPVSLSWGAVQVLHSSLRQGLEDADRQMYEKKRRKLAFPASGSVT